MTAGVASAPASSGNLGPGFDILALALDLRCSVTATVADEMAVHERGECTPVDEDDFVARAALAAVGRSMHLEISNVIPRARGLGSSAAVAAAAAAASLSATGHAPDRARVFDIVAELEGHGDNAGAAVYGGLVAVIAGKVAPLPMHDSLEVMVAVPETRLPTTIARGALADHIERAVVVRSLGRLAFLIEGLRTADPDVLAVAGGDELHEQPRATLSPMTGALIDAALAGGALHAAWSGAGPAAIAFTTRTSAPAVRAAFEGVLTGAGTVIEVGVDRSGLR